MDRRNFIQKSAAGAFGIIGFDLLASWYAQVKSGLVLPPDLPGLGMRFKKGLFERDDVIVETIAEI